jgi:hypothetical protein
VETIDVSQDRILVHERGGSKPRTFEIEAPGLIPN